MTKPINKPEKKHCLFIGTTEQIAKVAPLKGISSPVILTDIYAGYFAAATKGKWGVITPDDLEKATPKIRKNDIVMINTGTHHKLADSDEYYAYSPGLYKEAAEWLVDKQVKMVGVDVQALEHDLLAVARHRSGELVRPEIIRQHRKPLLHHDEFHGAVKRNAICVTHRSALPSCSTA